MPGHEDVPPAPTEDPAYTKLADVDTAYKPGKDIVSITVPSEKSN
jgi:hypothetical protein